MESEKIVFAGYDSGYSNAKLTYGWSDEDKITTEIYPATGYRLPGIVKTQLHFLSGKKPP
jgi:hypothetical protein